MGLLSYIAKGIGYSILGLLLIGVIIGVSSSDDQATGNMAASESGQSDDQVESTEEIHELGDRVSVGSLEYQATFQNTYQSLGNSFTQEQANGVFLVFSVDVKNTGKEGVYLSSSNFELKDDADRTYQVSTSATTQLTMAGLDTFTFEQLGPGLSSSGNVAFDVPEEATGLELMVSSDSFAGGQEAISVGDVQNLGQ